MINRMLIACFLFGSWACGSQDSKKSNAPLQSADEEEKVLGEEDDGKSSELGSEDAQSKTGEGQTKDVDKEVTNNLPSNIDLSKIEELIYTYKDGADLKEIAVKFQENSCTIATAAGIINGSFLECAALKTAIANFGSVPIKAGETCENALEQVVVKAGGLEQALSTKTVPGCELPVLPEGAADLLTEALKKLPN